MPGYWKTLKKDCIKCHCNEIGSIDSICNQETGQCNCRPGVTAQNCDQCLPDYYGTVETGCIQCEPCYRKGHVCGKGGKCLCPPLSIGKECERCALNSWGYEPLIGCKACNCSQSGSNSLQCDKISGNCSCKLGYEDTRCDRCAFGYYGYPNCRKCLCHSIGTLESECQNGDCQCNENGSCNCKENVKGSKCNICKNGTFGLSKENLKGCKQCFCFGRSNQCVDTKYNWDKIRYEKLDNTIENNEPISSDTISLPKQFMGDLTTSYDGYLSVNGSGGRFSVFLTGNGVSLKSDISSNELRLNEKHWRVTSGNILPSCQISLTRECLLLALQKITSIVIQGQDMEIFEVLLDSAKPYIPYNRTSHSIEKCDCTPEFTGLSCQDPNNGYYRYFPTEYEVTQTPWIDNVIGIAKPCDCNGRSRDCDPDTGYCQNCSNNTAGFHCELCDTGFYQDFTGNCQPCLCPSEQENNAESCVAKKHGFIYGLRTKFKMLHNNFTYTFDGANKLLKKGNIDEMENSIFNMVNKVEEFEKDIDGGFNEIIKQQKEIDIFRDELKRLHEDINDLIDRLRNFGKKHVDIEAAVGQANSLLKEIRENIQRKVLEMEYYSNPIFDYCKKISKEVYSYFDEPLELPFDDLDKINEKLEEIDLITREIEDKVAVAEFQNDQNRINTKTLSLNIKNLDNTTNTIKNNIKETTDKIKLINQKLKEFKETVESMENFDFSDSQDLEEKLYQFEEDSPDLEDLVRRACEHVTRLQKSVNDRIGALNFTEDETRKIKTSRAYNDILDGIAVAKNTAADTKGILEDALNIMYPSDSDRLIDKANLAHSQSDRLKYRITNMKNISNYFNLKKRDVEDFKEGLIDSGRFNNDLNRQLLNLEGQIISKGYLVDKLRKAIEDSSKVIDQMRQLEKDISELNITVRYDLFNEKDVYLIARNEADNEIRKARDSVNEAIKKVTQLLENNMQIDDNGIKYGQIKLNNVTSKIGELQNKILYARQAAESVNVAMGLSNCSMLYSVPQTEVFRSLAITFKCANCQLFKWDNGGMTISIRNGSAILNFTSEDQEENIITVLREGGLKIEKTLFVERTGSLLQMKFDNDTIWQKKGIGSRVLVVDPSDRFQVGDGFPTQNNAYIYKFAINDKNVGLWKFAQTFGKCKGQARVNSKELDGARPFYSGNGYTKYGLGPLTPARFAMRFYFSTFDENSLIYLAQETDNPSAFIALTLEDGRIRLDVCHNNGKTVVLKTLDKFNDGRTYFAEIAMEYARKIQYYTLDTDKNKQSTREQLDNKAVFRIKKAKHFLGGIAPSLDRNLLNIKTTSFLGFLSHQAQLSNELIASGVTPKTGELELDKAWFNGNGSLQVSMPLSRMKTGQKLDAISFILRPLNANAAVLDIHGFGTVKIIINLFVTILFESSW
ncbi:unnamed protein product [Ceutorhynchus assimilis]|uniref:Laminin subunit alpha-1 n=1 Tax=Ceutorhynchus assimilis TaxID=467358 RepID=A0A9N9QFP2_9CUCU|nr:unnamed protein product [Ceutorhynchus assimilis]